MVSSFPTVNLIPLHSVADWERERLAPQARQIPLAVGCIPAVEPQTDGEKMVYNLAHRFFDASYTASVMTGGSASHEGIPPPAKRHFLEMAYKPRRTPILIRAEQAGWTTVEGVQASASVPFVLMLRVRSSHCGSDRARLRARPHVAPRRQLDGGRLACGRRRSNSCGTREKSPEAHRRARGHQG